MSSDFFALFTVLLNSQTSKDKLGFDWHGTYPNFTKPYIYVVDFQIIFSFSRVSFREIIKTSLLMNLLWENTTII